MHELEKQTCRTSLVFVCEDAPLNNRNMINYMDAFWLAVIEGITEFLPISSTGHMVLWSSFFGMQEDEFVKAFEVIIQFGAILSVVFLYRKKLMEASSSFYKKILFSFLPTAIIGFILKNKVDEWLGSVSIVAWSMVLGGVVLIASDRVFKKQLENGKSISDLTYLQCIYLGIFQSVAMIPGVSRSGATIIAGLGFGLSKKEAAEYSFFLAIPTMLAATLYKVYKLRDSLSTEHTGLLLFGSIVAFIVALLAVKSFVGWISKHGFSIFGYYRIVLGVLILIFAVS